MRCPFFWIALPFLAGIALFIHIPAAQASHALYFLLPALALSCGRKIFLPIFCCTWFLLGGLYAHADHARPANAIENFISPNAFLKGRVSGLPEVKKNGRKKTVSFVLEAREAGKRAVVGKVQIFLINPRTVPGPGDQVALLGKLEKPRSFGRNFDYALYLNSQGVSAVFQGIGWRCVSVLEKGKPSLMARIREGIAAVIDRFSSGQSAIIFKALVLGSRAGLDSGLKESFFRSGTSHLLAISGLNIALVAGSFYLLLVMLRLERRAAAALAIAAAVFQVSVAGSGFPVLRAGWMAGASFLAIVLDRPRHSLNTFFLSLLCVLLQDTRAVENVSFQLSFLSVFSMIVFFPLWEEWRWKELWAVPLAVALGTFPVVVWHFGGISTVSWLSNFLAVPFFHFTLLGVLAGLVFFWLPGAGFLFFGAASFFLNLALGWIRFCSAGKWSYINLQPLSLRQTVVYYLVLGGIMAVRLGMLRSKFSRAKKKDFSAGAGSPLQMSGSLRS